MLWTASPDQFLIFVRDSQSYLIIAAPYIDADGAVVAATPPPGLQAPVSGFGLVWRGAIIPGNENFNDLPTKLGWAIEAERLYATDFQCAVASNHAEERCFLRDPAGAVVSITPNGAWAYVGE
jgi:hypothetical protein